MNKNKKNSLTPCNNENNLSVDRKVTFDSFDSITKIRDESIKIIRKLFFIQITYKLVILNRIRMIWSNSIINLYDLTKNRVV